MSSNSVTWFAVHTKPRQEHTALLNLERQSFQCYLPMTAGARQSARTKRIRRQEPLFPRYLFLNADPERQNLSAVRSTRGVTDLVRAGIELIKIPASIIAALQARMHPTTGLIAVDSPTLSHGDCVRVFDGPFARLEGIFKEHRGPTRSLMLLQILGRETAVEIDSRLLRRVL